MRRPGVRALMIGSGPEEKRLKQYAVELGVADQVEFRREVPYADMPSVYAQASCLVLASLPTWFWDEQFGMVLIEALAAGLPVVATTTGAIPEVLSGQGDLFAAGDWIGLAKILEQVRWPVLRASASHPTRISSRTTEHRGSRAAGQSLRSGARRLTTW